MQSQPTPEHQWLKKLVGEWTYEGAAAADCTGASTETVKTTARETVRALGDLWVIAELHGMMPGCDMEMSCITTLGFDPAKGKYIGTWVGTPMAMMFVYEGVRSADGKTLPLECMGPSFTDPDVMTKYRDVIEWKTDDERHFYSEILQPDGTWNRFMHGVHRRVK